MSANELRETAPAKVNLTLRVGAPRADGYHPLDSLVVFADWGDEVRVRPSPAFLLSMSGDPSRQLSPGGDNLVLRAAMALQSAAGIEQGAMIHLHKEIPVEAGLGGGSADAAATLRALNRLWGLGWPLDRLAELGLDLGADVPACIYSRPLRMRGIGEWIEMLPDWPAFHAIILNPGVAVPTGPVFRRFDESGPPPLELSGPPGEAVLDWLRGEPNDLEPSAREIAPEVGEALTWLDAQPGISLARMSGSGASCFGLADSAELAETVARAYPGFARAVTLRSSAGEAA